MIKNKLIATVILLLLSICNYAQLPGDIYKFKRIKDSAKISAEINTDYFSQSNVLNNEFMNKLFEGGFIDDSYKEDSQENLNINKNYIGYYNLYNGNASFYIEKIKSQLGFGYSYNDYWGGNFSKDAYNLLFYGSAHYKGEELNFSPTFYTATKYEEFYLIYRTEQIEDFCIEAELGLVKGREHQTISIPDGKLYTSPSGDSVSVDIISSSIIKQQDSFKDTKAHGWGLSVSLNIYYYPDNKNTFLFEIEDAGFVKWKDASLNYSEGIYEFGGADINLFTGQSAENLLNTDTLNSILSSETQQGNYSTSLPLRIRLGYNKQISSLLDINLGISWHLSSGRPLLYTSVPVSLPYDFKIIPYFSAGGYTRFDVGAGLQKSLFDSFIIGADTWYLESLINAKGTTSQGARFYLKYQL